MSSRVITSACRMDERSDDFLLTAKSLETFFRYPPQYRLQSPLQEEEGMDEDKEGHY